MYAKRTGNEDYEWGPDPELTLLGQQQAQDVHDAFNKMRNDTLAMCPPLPQVLCSSPLRRSLATACITWRDIMPCGTPIHVREAWREIIGKNTCDQRKSRSHMLGYVKPYPFPVELHDPFSEEDSLWTPERESHDAMRDRVYSALEQVWENEAHDAQGTLRHLRSCEHYVSQRCDAAHL